MTLAPPTSVSRGYPLALPGATSATRYVGATASGAPASGTFAVGDFVLSQTGTLYVCTVAGTPGTWVAEGPTSGGQVLAYNEITAPVTITTQDTEATAVQLIAGTAVTYDGATTVIFEAWFPGLQANGSLYATLVLWDTASLGWLARLKPASLIGANQDIPPVYMARRFTPAAGSHTYALRGFAENNGLITTFQAGTGGLGNLMPAFCRVVAA